MAGVVDYPTEFRDPWIDDDGMLHFQLGVKRPSLAGVMHMFRNAGRLTRDGTRLLMVDARAMRLAPPARVWTFAPYRLNSLAHAIAFVFSEMTPTEVRKFQKGVASLGIPNRVFEEEGEAIGWLKSFDE